MIKTIRLLFSQMKTSMLWKMSSARTSMWRSILLVKRRKNLLKNLKNLLKLKSLSLKIPKLKSHSRLKRLKRNPRKKNMTGDVIARTEILNKDNLAMTRKSYGKENSNKWRTLPRKKSLNSLMKESKPSFLSSNNKWSKTLRKMSLTVKLFTMDSHARFALWAQFKGLDMNALFVLTLASAKFVKIKLNMNTTC